MSSTLGPCYLLDALNISSLEFAPPPRPPPPPHPPNFLCHFRNLTSSSRRRSSSLSKEFVRVPCWFCSEPLRSNQKNSCRLCSSLLRFAVPISGEFSLLQEVVSRHTAQGNPQNREIERGVLCLHEGLECYLVSKSPQAQVGMTEVSSPS